MQNNPILAHFSSEPTLIATGSEAPFRACIAALFTNDRAQEMLAEQASNEDGFWPAPDDWRAAYRPYVVKDGILQIPVKGVLLHNFSFNVGSYATGYTYIWRAFQRGMADGSVRGIALMCDTPGGMVAGNFELVDKMFAMKGTKPIWGFAHESAYSAGYSIISVADKVWVSRTGGVGSIGVVTSHTDLSAMYADWGIKITFIHAGKHKVDGNSSEPLPDDVKARIQTRIDALYDVFVATVARNRNMKEQAVRDTEALTFMASEATSNGLADDIGSLDDALAAFAADLSSDEGEDEMSTGQNQAVDQAALDAARAEGHATGLTAGRAEGATAEKTRITAIIGSEVGLARPNAALAAALDTDMTADQATAFLAKLPEEPKVAATKVEEPVGKTPFEGAMDTTGNPNLSAGGDKTETEAKDDGSSDVALARQFGLGGFRPAASH